jgi:hypothetical protein
METFNNIKTEISDIVFSWTGFNYDIHTVDNGDGTENITFDCRKDAQKFSKLYNEVLEEGVTQCK